MTPLFPNKTARTGIFNIKSFTEWPVDEVNLPAINQGQGAEKRNRNGASLSKGQKYSES